MAIAPDAARTRAGPDSVGCNRDVGSSPARRGFGAPSNGVGPPGLMAALRLAMPPVCATRLVPPVRESFPATRVTSANGQDAGKDSRYGGCEEGFSHQPEGFSHQPDRGRLGLGTPA